MKAQILNQLKQATDSNEVDVLLDRLNVILYLEKFEIMRELLNHLGIKPLIKLGNEPLTGGAGAGERINLFGSSPNVATKFLVDRQLSANRLSAQLYN